MAAFTLSVPSPLSLGRCFFLLPVENRTSISFIALIEEWILPGSLIISDCWKSYSTIKFIPMKFYLKF